MTIVYARTFKMWVTSDKTRMEQPMDFLKPQFDALLEQPLPGQTRRTDEAAGDFIDDYRKLIGQGG